MELHTVSFTVSIIELSSRTFGKDQQRSADHGNQQTSNRSTTDLKCFKPMVIGTGPQIEGFDKLRVDRCCMKSLRCLELSATQNHGNI